MPSAYKVTKVSTTGNVIIYCNIFVDRPDYLELGFSDICPLNPVEIVMELALQEVDLIVDWTYKIPGFKELDGDDQASLVSTGANRIILVYLCPFDLYSAEDSTRRIK